MASPTQWTWVWANSRRWWRTEKPGVLQSMGSQRVGSNWATEQQQKYFISKQSEWIIQNNTRLESFGDYGLLAHHFISGKERVWVTNWNNVSGFVSIGILWVVPRAYRGKGRHFQCHTLCTYSLRFSPKQLSQQKTQKLGQAELALLTGTKSPHPMTFSKSGRARCHSQKGYLHGCAPAVSW